MVYRLVGGLTLLLLYLGLDVGVLEAGALEGILLLNLVLAPGGGSVGGLLEVVADVVGDDGGRGEGAGGDEGADGRDRGGFDALEGVHG